MFLQLDNIIISYKHCRITIKFIHKHRKKNKNKFMMDIEPHHIKSEPCTTRPKYREGKKPKVVKVYKYNYRIIII